MLDNTTSQLKEKLKFSKHFAISKIIHLALIVSVSVFTTKQINIRKKNIICLEENPKTKHSTLQNTYELGAV